MLRRRLLIITMMLSLLAATAFAQNGASGKSFVQAASEERMYTVTVYSAKPEMWTESLQFIKNEVVPANVKGGRKHMEVWTSVFGQSYEAWFILPLENFASMDKPDETLLKGLGSREAVAAFWHKARSLNTSVRQFVIKVRPELSFIKPDAPTPRLASFSMVEVAYGREAEAHSLIKSEWIPALKKSGRNGTLRASIVAGDVTGYVTFTPRENFAELDQPGATEQALGKDGERKAVAKFAGTITRIERRTLLLRTDLSILPK